MKPVVAASIIIVILAISIVAGYYLLPAPAARSTTSTASSLNSSSSTQLSSTTSTSGPTSSTSTSTTSTSSTSTDPLTGFGTESNVVYVGNAPYGLAYDPATGETFVAVSGSNCIMAIKNDSQVVGDIALGNGSADFIAFDQANSLLYAALVGNNSIAVINTTSDTVVSSIPVPTSSGWLAYDPASQTIYSVNRESNAAYVLSNETLVGTITLTGLPFAIAFDPSDGDMYVTDNAGQVFIINGTTNSLMGTLQVAGASSTLLGVAYNPVDHGMYVTSYTDDAVYIINGSKAMGTIQGFNQPIGIASSSTSSEMFVVNSGNATVSAVWDGRSATADVGTSPREIVFDPSTQAVIVSDYGNSTLSVLGP